MCSFIDRAKFVMIMHLMFCVTDQSLFSCTFEEQSVNINWKKADEPSIQRYRDNLARCYVFQRLCERSFESQSSLNVAYIELTDVLKIARANVLFIRDTNVT